MSIKTNISWAHHTKSRWMGCRRRSPGCENCYIPDTPPLRRIGYKLGDPRIPVASFESDVRKWDAQAKAAGERRRIFPSLCDWLDDEVSIEWLADFLRAISETPNLDWLLLTKRPELWSKRVEEASCLFDQDSEMYNFCFGWMVGQYTPHNVWFGVTVENQATAYKRIPELLKIPAKVRWLSVEPLLERIDLDPPGIRWLTCPRRIDWVVVGGESGNKRRDCGVEAIANVAEQCQADAVPVFVKQDCHRLPGQQGRIPDHIWNLKQFPSV